jgi:hypothetical protein
VAVVIIACVLSCIYLIRRRRTRLAAAELDAQQVEPCGVGAAQHNEMS